jgi:hypothetical protein
MTTTRASRLSRRTAQRLLQDPTSANVEPLSYILAAAAAPGRAPDPAAEYEALSRYRTCRVVPAAESRRPSMLKMTVTKLLAAKLLTFSAIVLAATGGVALAAATSNLPAGLQNFAHNTVNAPPPNHSTPAVPTNVAATLPDISPTAAGSTTHPGSLAPNPSLKGICTAYHAGATKNSGKAASNPAFSALAAAAGGEANISAFCASLTTSTNEPTEQPSPTSSDTPSSAHPGNPNTTHPSGPPSTHPGNDTHPNEAPSSHPDKP